MGKAGILQRVKRRYHDPRMRMYSREQQITTFLRTSLLFLCLKIRVVSVFEGTMITVLGTSLQNKDILSFCKSSWKAVGLEMEGAHYQKAIQSASKIRHSIHPDVDFEICLLCFQTTHWKLEVHSSPAV